MGDALQVCAAPCPKNCPTDISNSTMGRPTRNSSIMYGIKYARPYLSISRGKRTTLAYVIFRQMHRTRPRNTEHFV